MDTIGAQTATETLFFKIREKRPICGGKSFTGKELFLPLTLEKSVKSVKNVGQRLIEN